MQSATYLEKKTTGYYKMRTFILKQAKYDLLCWKDKTLHDFR